MLRRRFTIVRGGGVELPPNDEIWYTSSDGEVVMPDRYAVFGANIVSNTYVNGKGIIKFDGDVASIVDQAFYNCYNLTSITIPNSVTRIKGGAFYYCAALKEVICKPTTPPTGGSDMFNGISSSAKIYVPAGSGYAYRSAQYWSNYADMIVEM